MKKKWRCKICGEKYSSKQFLISHLEGEINEMENTITDSKETIFEAQEQIDELKPNGTHR